MGDLSTAALAAMIVELQNKVAVLETASQLPSSSIAVSGGDVSLSDVATGTADATTAIPWLSDLLDANATAVAAAGEQADAAADAAAQAGELGRAAGETALAAAAGADEKADNALSNASDALDAANRAETSANGKTRNVYSTSPPPSPDPDASTRTDGDSWYIITSAGLLTGVYQWSASAGAWQQQTLTGGAVGNLDAGVIVSGYIAAARIAANTITSAMIQADAITAREIAAATITSAEIAAHTVTAANIVGNTITAAEIAANTITAAQIAAGTITASQIAANAITATQLAANAVVAASIAAGAIDGKTITGAILRTASSGTRTQTDSTGLSFYAPDNTKVGSLSPLNSSSSYITRLGLAAADNVGDGSGAYEILVGPVKSVAGYAQGIALSSTKGASFGGPGLFANALQSLDGVTPYAGTGVMPGMYSRTAANQSIASGTQTVIALGASVEQNALAKQTSGAGHGWVLPVTGWYAISLALIHSTTSSGGGRTLYIYSGTSVMAQQVIDIASSGSIAAGGVFYLPANNVVTFQIVQNTGAALTIAVQQAGIRYLGPA